MNSFYGNIEIENLDNFSFSEKLKNDKNAIILDVRTLEEHNLNRLPNSLLIDIYELDFYEKINQLDKTKSYFVYCRSGVRSLEACKQMKKLGFEKVYNLRNGIIEWDGEIVHR